MLSSDDYKLTTAALESLSSRQAEIGECCDLIARKLGRGEILCGIERNYLALALQGHALLSGPPSFDAVERIAADFGVSEELAVGLMSWLAYAEEKGAVSQ